MTNFFYSGVKHYGLVMKDTPDWNRAIHKAKERDSDFLAEYMSKAGQSHQRKMITEKAIKMASSPIESILQLIEKGLHA